MHTAFIDFTTGVIIGGLGMSACWGWLWLTIGTVGLSRGTCSWRVVLNSLAVGVVPLLLGWALLWLRAEAFTIHTAFVLGIPVMPLVLTGLSLRPGSDGRRAGLHMIEGVRHLMDELLGTHRECGGCDHDHGTESGERG
jgi:hypothetical protein